MDKLHHKLMTENSTYAKWNNHPLSTVIHFVVFVIIAAILAILIQNKALTSLNQKTLSLSLVNAISTTSGYTSNTPDNPVTITKLTSSSLDFSWPAITGATGYKIYLAPEPESLSIDTERKLITSINTSTLKYKLTNLAANVDVFIRIEGEGTEQYYDLYAKTPGGQGTDLDNIITNGQAGTAIQSVSLYAPNILLLVIKDKRAQSFSSTDNTLDHGVDHLSNYTGPTWQSGTWSITRNNASKIAVSTVYRDSIPVGHLYDQLADTKKDALGMYSHLMDVDHYIYLKLNQNIGTKDILTITGPNGLNLTIPYSDRYLETPVIQVNQVGYNPRASERYAYVSGWMGDGGALPLGNFPVTSNVLLESTNPLISRVVTNPNLSINSRSASDADSGTSVKDINLASLSANNSNFYRVQVPGVGVSYRTMVSELATLKAYYVVTRGLFLNRWGRDLSCTYTDWCSRPADHSPVATVSFPGVYKNDQPTLPSTQFPRTPELPKQNLQVLQGGHHDAGDFDIKSQHYQVARQLMRAYELNSQALSGIKLNIPESSPANNIPDLLDEALYSLKAWEQLQDSDGGVRMGAESNSHPAGFYFADTDPLPYWTLPKDPTHSLRVAGLFAQASRLVKPFNTAKSDDLKQRAIKAFDYSIQNGVTASVGGPMEYATGELYRLTNDSKYKAKFEEAWKVNEVAYNKGAPTIWPLENWTSVYSFPKNTYQPILGDHVLAYLGITGDSTVSTYKSLAMSQFITQANTVKDTINTTYAFRNGRKAGWGSAWGKSVALGEYLMPIYSKIQLELNNGITNRDQSDINAISLSADYILGANPMGMSWVTGLGSRSPQNPLHSDSIAFGITKGLPPIPGIPVYGPVEAGNPNYYDFGKNATYPAISTRPPLRKYIDLRSFVNNNEFTVWETQSNVASLFATLVGSGLTIPSSWTPGQSNHQDPLALDQKIKPVSSSGSHGAQTPPEEELTPTTSALEMISVPAGTFPLGDNTGSANEKPVHNVTLSAYDIGKFEVTNNQYIEFLDSSRSSLKKSDGSTWSGGRYDDIYGGANPKLILGFRLAEVSISFDSTKNKFIPKTKPTKSGQTVAMGDYPTTDVTWYGAVMYANWLSTKEGLQPVYNTSTWTADLTKNGYRLPTEAEWEKAAAWDGNKHWAYGFKSDTLTGGTRANYYDGTYVNPGNGGDLNNSAYVNPIGLIQDALTPYTSPVGWFNGVNVSPNGNIKTVNSPSPVGAYDMSGNVFEWTNDWYKGDYYASSPTTNPGGPASSPDNTKVIRGGAWGRVVGATNSRTSSRKAYLPTTADGMIGFRLAKNTGTISITPVVPPTTPTKPESPTTPSGPTSPSTDTTNPTITITAPKNNDTVFGIVTISVDTADDSGKVSKVELYSTTGIFRKDISAPFNFSFDTITIKNGKYPIYAKAYDQAGNIGISDTVTVNVYNIKNASNVFYIINNLLQKISAKLKQMI